MDLVRFLPRLGNAVRRVPLARHEIEQILDFYSSGSKTKIETLQTVEETLFAN
jgi:hypothetical protein